MVGRSERKPTYSGGIQGGISNGEDIYFNVAFKPVATIMQDQSTVDKHGNETNVSGKGRHDPCVVPRAVPIVEAMAALVIADFYLRYKISKVVITSSESKRFCNIEVKAILTFLTETLVDTDIETILAVHHYS